MTSVLVLSSVQTLQQKINYTIKSLQKSRGLYISLDKTQKSAEMTLKKAGIRCNYLFFIDSVTSEFRSNEMVHIPPTRLDLFQFAVYCFISHLPKKQFLIIDNLSTLLIYNDLNKVAMFVKKITEFASKHDVEVIIFSSKSQNSELSDKIFNFFDKVEQR